MKALKKTILYRLISVSSTFLITYAITRELIVPTAVTMGHLVVHSIIYYLFERATSK